MEYALAPNSGKLQLIFADAKIKPIAIDFLSPALRHRFAHGGGLKQLLAKAIGAGKGQPRPYVLDVTAGFGVDAVILAQLGCKVLMLERSSIMYALLADALKRAKANNATFNGLKLRLLAIDARKYLQRKVQRLEAASSSRIKNIPDVIFLDPMYPERKKSALNKIEMRVLRNIVGDDPDAAELLKLALHCARKRVVVKRPRAASCLGDLEPDLKFVGKSCRFDVYFT